MASNQTTEFTQFDNLGGSGCKTVAPSSAYTVASDVNYVQAAGAITITLDANSNSPVYLDSNAHACIVTDGTRNYDFGDTGQVVSVECRRIGGAGNTWIVLGAALS